MNRILCLPIANDSRVFSKGISTYVKIPGWDIFCICIDMLTNTNNRIVYDSNTHNRVREDICSSPSYIQMDRWMGYTSRIHGWVYGILHDTTPSFRSRLVCTKVILDQRTLCAHRSISHTILTYVYIHHQHNIHPPVPSFTITHLLMVNLQLS